MGLNTEKSNGRRVPRKALDRLLRKLEGVVEDVLSSPDGAAQQF